MAVLAMPYLSDDIVHCNGVAITRNPFRAGLPGYFLNVQLGSHKVCFSNVVSRGVYVVLC